MASLEASDVARLLVEFGQRLALRGENSYRARAYRRAAESLSALSTPLAKVIEKNQLQELPGIGAALAAVITTLHRQGTHPALEKMRREVPEGVLDLLQVPGLRADKATKLHKDLGIGTLDELEQACRAGRLAKTKAFGPSLERKILEGIEIRRRTQGQRHIHSAAALIEVAAARLRESHPELSHVVPAGEFRRGCELVSDIVFVAQTPDPGSPRTVQLGDITLHIAGRDCYGLGLLQATGSEQHLAQLAKLAEQKGLSLAAPRSHRSRKPMSFSSEEDIYAALGLPFIPPELREGRNEIELALKRRLPALVEEEDLRGILHAHTAMSDGVNSLEQMTEATRERGYAYFGVADHSRSAAYAGGLTVDEIKEQHHAINMLNRKYKGAFRVLKGIESDILADGSLDYANDVLASFDFVVASVHSRFRLDREEQTERIIRAVSNPYTTILGHMTGRQLLRRPGYEVDIEKVLRACAKHDVAVEINANPWRLDLDWRWHQMALDLGCTMSINPDAHSTAEIDLTRWGVLMARKGGVPKERVLNSLSLPALTKYLAAKRTKALRPKRSRRSAKASSLAASR